MNATAWIIIAVIALLIGWDGYAAIRWGYSYTISADLLKASQERPIIAFALGVVMGHIFWVNG